MSPLLLGLLAGGAVFLILGPGPPPGRPTALYRLYARLGAVPPAGGRPGPAAPWVRRLPLGPLATWLERALGPRYRRQMERLLRIAGLDSSYTYRDMLAMKAGLTLGCWLYVGLILLKRHDLALGLFLGSLGVLGFLYPDTWVLRRANRRQQQVSRELPAFLSALAVALEAGLNLMAAVAEVTRERQGVLAAALRQAVERWERGMRPAEALEQVTRELEVTELTMVLTGLLQAFARGSGHVVRTVREQAAEAWGRRRSRAEAMAQTASVKLFLPIALLALPGFLVFLLGPAVLEVLDYIHR